MEKYLNHLSELQNSLINYLDLELQDIKEDEPNFCNLIQYLSTNGIISNKSLFKIFLKMFVVNSSNHFRSINFNSKIALIFSSFKKDLIQQFSNEEIFEIFKPNKMLLLYLLEENLLYFNFEMEEKLKQDYGYFQYLQKYLHITKEEAERLIELDKELQKEGENHLKIAKVIREDKLNDFINEIETHKISYNSDIEESIYDTNEFFKTHLYPRYIEYAAFHGSINVFKNLCLNKAQFHPIIWQCAIHGKNHEIIHIIEGQNNFVCKYDEHDDTEGNMKEAIRCHHNEIAAYYYENNCVDLGIDLAIISECFNSFNLSYLTEYFQTQFFTLLSQNAESIIDLLVANDYVDLVILLLSNDDLKFEYKLVFKLQILMKNFFMMQLNINHLEQLNIYCQEMMLISINLLKKMVILMLYFAHLFPSILF